jgi:hypothetical protein
MRVYNVYAFACMCMRACVCVSDCPSYEGHIEKAVLNCCDVGFLPSPCLPLRAHHPFSLAPSRFPSRGLMSDSAEDPRGLSPT